MEPRLNFIRAIVASLAFLASAALADGLSLRFLGEHVLSSSLEFAGEPVGGLSGIDFDSAAGSFLAISDDRGDRAPARVYRLHIDVGGDGIHAVRIDARVRLRDAGGRPYTQGSVDPEAVRTLPGGGFAWTSEGAAKRGLPPALRISGEDGALRRQLPVPARFVPANGRGVRDNYAFEALARTPAGELWVGTENALIQDGPAADTRAGALTRVLRYSAEGFSTGEYAYALDAGTGPDMAGLPSATGLAELLHLDGMRFLALERSWSLAAGYTARLYLADFSRAIDVSSLDSLAGASVTPAAKTLLLGFSSLGIQLDNLEGMSFGPALGNGKRTLLVVSDNNFTGMQFTQFLLFEL